MDSPFKNCEFHARVLLPAALFHEVSQGSTISLLDGDGGESLKNPILREMSAWLGHLEQTQWKTSFPLLFSVSTRGLSVCGCDLLGGKLVLRVTPWQLGWSRRAGKVMMMVIWGHGMGRCSHWPEKGGRSL